jgi:TonB family protein
MWNYKKFPATICGVIAMLSGSQVQAQEPQVSIEKQGAVEELRGIVDSALTAARLHNEAKLKEVAHAMMIPDPTTWFVATFGEEQGMKMASAYEANLDREENTLPWLFQRLTKRKGEMLIQNAATTKSLGASPCAQALLKSAKRESSFYRVGLEWNNGPNVTGFSSLGYFTLVDGTYRRLDCQVLGLGWDGAGASGLLYGLPILRVEGSVQATKILHSVQPVYPDEAQRDRISGKVRLHVLLAKDGTVEEIGALSGHPLLQNAALEAVRKWRYRPTLVNSIPVEVDTFVEVTFPPSK